MSFILDLCGNWSSILVLLGLVSALRIIKDISSFLASGMKAYILPWLLGPVDPLKTYGRWALVTGCTGGIGREYATGLASKGMDMILVSRSKDKLEKLDEEIKEMFGVNTLIIQADFTNVEVIGDIVKQVEGREIGILVNNVGIFGSEQGAHLFTEMDRKSAMDLINVNISAATILCHDLIPAMVKRGQGAVINIGSVVGLMSGPYFAMYCASKHYIHAFTEAIREELKDTGIFIQEITPGMVETAMTEKEREKFGELVMPKVKKFVSSSLSSLGWTTQTCGYWFHSCQLPIISQIPAWFMAKALKQGYLKQKEKRK